MTQPKRERLMANNKDTRWDRIRKRHCSNILTNLKSDAVKKFIEIDYIGRHQQNLLNGDAKTERHLDPVLVMNLRHEMFKKIPRKLPLATIAFSKNLQQCKDHNVAVEEHYIESQLKQFRKHLQKQHKHNKLPLKKINPLLIDNTNVMNSLESTHKHIEDFYNAPIEAIRQVQDLFTGQLGKHVKMLEVENSDLNDPNRDAEDDEDTTNLFNFREEAVESSAKTIKQDEISFCMTEQIDLLNLNNAMFEAQHQTHEMRERTASPLQNAEEVLKPFEQAIEEPAAMHLKYVRFEDKIIDCNGPDHQLQRESSNCSYTSDGIDSVISDLAEEALRELQMEEELKTNASRLERSALHFNKCHHKFEEENKNQLMITGQMAPHEPIPIKAHAAKSVRLRSAEKSDENVYLNSEQAKIIHDLFQAQDSKQTSVVRKYFLKWVHYTTMEKIEREHVDVRADRIKKINIFLNKIRIEKKRLKHCQNENGNAGFNKTCKTKETMENIKMNKKYENKIKVQQDIIDLQRSKLERQERIIMELKLHKLSEESKEARQELKMELKSVIRSGDPKSKAKAKCLQIIGNLKDEQDDDFSKLQGKSLLNPKFLQNMYERTLERDIRHQQAKQRRQQHEAEREAQKLALEEAKRLEDEEAKRLRIENLKEKRRQEKMAKIIKERERQKYFENQRKAQDFYNRILLKRFGMEGFKRLLQRKKHNLEKCEELRQSLYKKTYFQAWFSLYRINKSRRNQKADELYEKLLKRNCISIWLQCIYAERCKFNIAVDYSELKLTENMFRKWNAYAQRMRLLEECKMKQAISHHEWNLKWKVLDCWQKLPQILILEKETEERRQRWRLKIWELLPDYTPNRDDFTCL